MRFFLIVVLLLVTSAAFGQIKPIQRDELLFEKALSLQQLIDEDLNLDEIANSKASADKKEFAIEVKETMLDKALEYYQELIDSFPRSNLLFRALNNKGFIELSLDDRKDAKRTFLRIINSKADDKEKGGIGSGIMGEPYANYKNRAAKALANISIKDSNYKKALYYLDLTKKYPYKHFCGNEYASDKIYIATLYGKCYLCLKNYPEAYRILLPHIIYNGLASNSDAVELAYNALLINYTKADLRRRYENAVRHCKIEYGDLNKGEESSYSLVFLGTKIGGSLSFSFELIESKIEKDKAIKKSLLESEFYKLLTD